MADMDVDMDFGFLLPVLFVNELDLEECWWYAEYAHPTDSFDPNDVEQFLRSNLETYLGLTSNDGVLHLSQLGYISGDSRSMSMSTSTIVLDLNKLQERDLKLVVAHFEAALKMNVTGVIVGVRPFGKLAEVPNCVSQFDIDLHLRNLIGNLRKHSFLGPNGVIKRIGLHTTEHKIYSGVMSGSLPFQLELAEQCFGSLADKPKFKPLRDRLEQPIVFSATEEDLDALQTAPPSNMSSPLVGAQSVLVYKQARAHSRAHWLVDVRLAAKYPKRTARKFFDNSVLNLFAAIAWERREAIERGDLKLAIAFVRSPSFYAVSQLDGAVPDFSAAGVNGCGPREVRTFATDTPIGELLEFSRAIRTGLFPTVTSNKVRFFFADDGQVTDFLQWHQNDCADKEAVVFVVNVGAKDPSSETEEEVARKALKRSMNERVWLSKTHARAAGHACIVGYDWAEADGGLFDDNRLDYLLQEPHYRSSTLRVLAAEMSITDTHQSKMDRSIAVFKKIQAEVNKSESGGISPVGLALCWFTCLVDKQFLAYLVRTDGSTNSTSLIGARCRDVTRVAHLSDNGQGDVEIGTLDQTGLIMFLISARGGDAKIQEASPGTCLFAHGPLIGSDLTENKPILMTTADFSAAPEVQGVTEHNPQVHERVVLT